MSWSDRGPIVLQASLDYLLNGIIGAAGKKAPMNSHFEVFAGLIFANSALSKTKSQASPELEWKGLRVTGLEHDHKGEVKLLPF